MQSSKLNSNITNWGLDNTDMKPLIAETSKLTYFMSRVVDVDITTNDNTDGVLSKLWNYGDASYIQLSNYIGGLATSINVEAALDGQSASWNCNLQYFLIGYKDGIYLRLRHDKSRNMRVKVYVFAQFNVTP